MLQNFTLSSPVPEQNKREHLLLQKYFTLSNILKGAKQVAAVAILTNRYFRKISRKKCYKTSLCRHWCRSRISWSICH
jgi:hypothetical protein